MKRFILLAAAFAVLVSTVSAAAAEMTVIEAVITTGVEERAPVDAVQTYPAVGKLYCYTHVTGAEEETSISHVWFMGDTEMARITLPVRSSNWRTWSSKTFLPQWTGEWRVEILDSEGTLLESVPFTLTRE